MQAIDEHLWRAKRRRALSRSLIIDGRGGRKSRRKREVVICDQEGNSTLCKAMRLSLG